ncbi:unnamed protein product [Parajaminaea phylloscopi]
MATSRLDRLVLLLETGSTPAIKGTAAAQLGQIASQRVRGGYQNPYGPPSTALKADQHDGQNPADTTSKQPLTGSAESDISNAASSRAPHTAAPTEYRGTRGEWDEALHLCSRIVPFLHSRSWDTREAAALAIENICRGAGIWELEDTAYAAHNLPSSSTKQEDQKPPLVHARSSADQALKPISQVDLLSFYDFHLEKVLANGTKLLSSAGKEYDILSTGASMAAHLAQAKADMARMGLGGLGGVEMDLGLDVEEELKQGARAPSQGSLDGKSAGLSTAPISSHDTSAIPPKPLTDISRGVPRPSDPREEHNAASEAAPSASTLDDEPDLSKLSARERNQLKRKRKMEGKGAPGVRDDKTRRLEQTISSPRGADSLSVATGLRPGSSPLSAAMPGTPVAAASQASESTDLASKLGNETSSTRVSTPTAGSPAPSNGKGGDAAYTHGNASLVAPSGEWPFTNLTSLLLLDLFSPRWEVRHGACLALRSIFAVQGSGGGKSLLVPSPEANDERKAKWSEDAAVKLICLLCLDRLSDFVFDQVIAPVREVAAQALSALLPHLSPASHQEVTRVLIDMTTQDFAIPPEQKQARRFGRRGDAGYAWEVRHAGLSGLRWLAESGRLDDPQKHSTLVPRIKQEDDNGAPKSARMVDIADIALACLRDTDDDVRAVASAVLLPLVPHLVSVDMADVLTALLDTIWECLSDIKDDLNSSTASTMDLLASLLKHESVAARFRQSAPRSLSQLVPLTYPFFRHTITSVRLSVLKTMSVFLTRADAEKAVDWIDDRVFRLLFQNLIVEEKLHIRQATMGAWQQALQIVSGVPGHLDQHLAPRLDGFAKILMTPLGTPFDFSLFFSAVTSSAASGEGRYNVDKSILAQDLSLVGIDAVIRGRLDATRALGAMFAHMHRTDTSQLMASLRSSSALQRCLAAYILQEWAHENQRLRGQDLIAEGENAVQLISQELLKIVEGPAPPTWGEMAVQLNRIQQDSQALVRLFNSEGKVPKTKLPILPSIVDTSGQRADAFTSETAERVVTREFEALSALVGPKVRRAAMPILEDRRRKIVAAIGFYRDAKDKQDTQVFASASAAIVALKTLPAKLNPIIRSIMNSVKFEDNSDLQQRSARAVAELIAHCRSPQATVDPSSKIVKNLCAFVCQDTTRTMVFSSVKDIESGILSLKETPSQTSKERSGQTRPGEADESESTRQGRLIRRGAEMALGELASRFGGELFATVPALWDGMTTALVDLFQHGASEADLRLSAAQGGADRGQAVLDCCTLIEVITDRLSADQRDALDSLLPHLFGALQSRFAAVRSAAARCFGALANTRTQQTLLFTLEKAIPLLGDAAKVTNRQGAIELLSQIVDLLGIRLLPYVVVLIIPVLGRMSDPNEQIRLVATSTFAALIKMVPLEAGLPDPPGFPAELLKRRDTERQFLAQLLDGNRVEPYDLPVKVNVELRKYQREGVSWMKFLSKFQLHGVLCDDMGLGKTLQSICILSANHFERAERHKLTGDVDSQHSPSLVICPPTLTGHWVHEIRTYANNLRPLLYSGGPAERNSLQGQIPQHDVVVLSYDVVRNDIAFFSSVNWNYCILDEGHIIKSAKTKTTKAVKMIRANHRLILSGTPIQNNVLELWSLFDFLMPGFLGSERSFHERFGKPLLASREGKATSKEQEAAALALESLHKQVLPFLLRRLKDDVLDDLPPKIIQDVECELGDIQKRLYEESSSTEAMGQVDQVLGDDDDESGKAVASGSTPEKQHVFQTLQYLRKLVNHPALVYSSLKPNQRALVDAQLTKSGSTLREIAHAPKLQSLMQLLHSCGIGLSNQTEGDAVAEAADVSSQHRVLVFCQMKQMLDIIEDDLFKPHMPSVSYMRLDGSVPSEKRHGIVQTFNSDPSIDVLLMTTQVGGLGLTLTGADTVIFMEHDWNPMKDLQAMDRAHRLGQKKVVNVYRLITRGTLEARIMGLQQFKLNVANTVISQQNKGLDSMQTDQVLDLFSASASGAQGANGSNKQSLLEAALAAQGSAAGTKTGKISQKALLAGMDALGDTGEDYAKLGEWRPPGSV